MLEMDEVTAIQAQDELRTLIKRGSIDANIMTKLDRLNYKKNEALPIEYNDAHAAFRGFANSKLCSSIVLSAGLNPRLYSYMANFEDFFPDANGVLKKKIVLKVSDYRSAIIQGKFLAKKGLWVSEYRIESGLNCGGHAFVNDGSLLGPILQVFKDNKEKLKAETFNLYDSSLKRLGRNSVENAPEIAVSVMGGVGTYDEHKFLIKHYQVDSVGWGTPFLLVPEAVNIDDATIDILKNAKEDDLFLSTISPLGIRFNSVKNNTKEVERRENIEKGIVGSPCPKKHLVFNNEFTEKPICMASNQYQKLKIAQLKESITDKKEFDKEYQKVVEKTCICLGLTNPALIKYNIPTPLNKKSVSVCPSKSMAYFSEIVSLQEMTDHIYGRKNIIKRTDRPNMFIAELNIYVDYLKNMSEEASKPISDKLNNYLEGFKNTINEGVDYYSKLFSEINIFPESMKLELEVIKNRLFDINSFIKQY